MQIKKREIYKVIYLFANQKKLPSQAAFFTENGYVKIKQIYLAEYITAIIIYTTVQTGKQVLRLHP